MGFADDMEQFDEEFEEAKDKPRPSGKYGPILPDGKHQAMILEARIEHDTQNNNDRYSMVWQFGNKDGGIRKFFNLDHEVGREIAAQDAALCGYGGKLSGLQAACEEEFFIGLVCEIGIKTKAGGDRDYANTYVNRCLGQGTMEDFTWVGSEDGTAAVGAGSASVTDDDDIPF